MPASESRGISVIVPTYNRGAYLDRWFEAFCWWRTDVHDVEVLVVDDGGADHSAWVCDRWRESGLDVRYIRVRPPGAPRNNAIARNVGLRQARHPLVLNSDPDIVFVTDVIGAMHAALRPGTFCSVGRYAPMTRTAWTSTWRRGLTMPLRADDYEGATRGRQNMVRSPDGVGGLHGACLCQRRVLESLGGYDERFTEWGWEDRDLLVRLEAAGVRRLTVPQARVVHQWHPLMRGDWTAAAARQMAWQTARAETGGTDPDLLAVAAAEVALWQARGDARTAAQVADTALMTTGVDSDADARATLLLARAALAYELGDAAGFDRLLADARRLGASVADLEARAAAERGDRREAMRILTSELDRGAGPGALFRCAELLVASDAAAEARHVLMRHEMAMNTFQQLQRAAYLQLLSEPDSPAGDSRLRVGDEPAGDFLVSAAGRALRDGLPLGARLLCDAYTRSEEGRDPDLVPRAEMMRADADNAWRRLEAVPNV